MSVHLYITDEEAEVLKEATKWVSKQGSGHYCSIRLNWL